ncbi:diguanylate cyclase (GGDEF)-like protein [Paraburkholderia tropica]|uniref:Diguanylate cyclase (GGDEF)-like protein n=2 Tax=Paraburkholderia tropica TaxID=92647 RepID=A0ABX5MGS5_9BURK|nr:diguanylate cyclase (GGDEF)-like protein [Paraburkholderia tropica]PZW73296.1 diguanylate cyclase (GGDEF)-like protein [Paraburkholderia tropica]
MVAMLAGSAASIDRALQATEAALAANAQRLVALDLLQQDLHSPAVIVDFRETLIRQTATLSSVISLSILDSQGHWTISSRFRIIPVIPANPRRPIWNAALHTPPSRSFVFGPGAPSAIDMKSFGVGRSARAADGRILGGALAFLSTDDIKRSFQAIDTEGGTVIASNPDGETLFALPSDTARIPAWARTRWNEERSEGGNSFEISDPEGHGWLVAVAASRDSPLVFTSIKSVDSVFESRRQFATTVFLSTAIALIATVTLFALWVRQQCLTHRKTLIAAAARERLISNLSLDPSTKLYNRAGLEKQLVQRDSVARPRALLMIGIDRFQEIAHALGNSTADQILSEVASRLGESAGPRCLAAHLGAGEFCVAQYDEDPEYLARKLLWTLSQPHRSTGRDLLFGVSVGISGGVQDLQAAQQEASAAMVRARAAGLGNLRWFDPALDRQIQDSMLIEQELRAAIGTDALYMDYQPILALETNRIAGFEALMRWKSASRGVVPPDVFIPIAESAGILLPVARMVRRSPLQAAAAWPQDIFVSINCPAYEFKDSSLPQRIRDQLRTTGVSAERCCIEVTESALLENDEIVLGVMRELKDIGIRLALDDFGTGHASLSYLRTFPFDRIKIDRSFIQGMNSDTTAAAIVNATLTLSRHMRLEVIAEGVETHEQLQRLKELGCDYAQGYLISRPLGEKDIQTFLGDFSAEPRPVADTPDEMKLVALQR